MTPAMRFSFSEKEFYLGEFRARPLAIAVPTAVAGLAPNELAVLLGVPLNGCDPRLADLGTKSGARKAIRTAGVEVPCGFEDLRERLGRRVERKTGIGRYPLASAFGPYALMRIAAETARRRFGLVERMVGGPRGGRKRSSLNHGFPVPAPKRFLQPAI